MNCLLRPEETICMKCQSLFSGIYKKKNIINLLSAEFAQRVVKVNDITNVINDIIKIINRIVA